MSTEITCRLCLEFCKDGYCDLYNEYYDGDMNTTITTNEVFELVKKYFPEELLNMDCSKHLTKLCLQCWHYIEEFHNFQETIIMAQSMKMSENFHIVEEEQQECEEVEMEMQEEDEEEQQETQSYVSEVPIKFEEFNICEVSSQEVMSHVEKEEIQDDEEVVGDEFVEEIVDDYIMVDNPENTETSNEEDSEDDYEQKVETTRDETTHLTNLYITEIIEHEDRNVTVQQRNTKELQTIEEYDDFIANWKSQLECVICYDSFETYSLLCDHFKEQHPEEECHIVCCDLRLQQRWEIVEHILYHKASSSSQKCDISFETAVQDLPAKKHFRQRYASRNGERFGQRQMKKDKLKIYKCKICDKVFFNNAGLRTHREAEHQQQTDIICTFCPQTFSQFTAFQSHLKTEHQQEWQMRRNQEAIEMLPEIRKHLAGAKLSQKNKLSNGPRKTKQIIDSSSDCKCPICGNIYHSKRYLRAHLALHGGKAMYLCQFCSKSYHLPNSLSYHIRLKHSGHTEVVQMKCHICNKIYYTKKALRQHLSMHEGKPSFSCKICSKEYFFSSSLSNHMKYFHAPNLKEAKARAAKSTGYSDSEEGKAKRKNRGPPESDPMPCHICNKVYYTKKALNQHLSKHEGRPSFTCKLCFKQYYFSSSFSNHMKYFHAPKKETTDSSKHKAKMLALVEKALAEGKTIYKCNVCDNVYQSRRTLKEHENTHGGQQSYTCKFCPKMYYLKSAMYNHMSKIHNYQPRKENSLKKAQKRAAQDNNESLDDLVEDLEMDETKKKTSAKGRKALSEKFKNSGLKCATCDRYYQSKRSLREHEAKHTGEELYSCKYCGKKFFLKSTMSTHIKKQHPKDSGASIQTKEEDTTACYDEEQQYAVTSITEEEIDVVTEEVITSTNV
ncbi:zinc finger protein 808-like [Musca domestica]|uniref:Zinc finger protein 808-like n=1 Tax=Musca domestica TaxID=7370 RepID=A0A9J7HXT7_MUSDO|nr:zinc finger protein 808-like [Musca domestica]